MILSLINSSGEAISIGPAWGQSAFTGAYGVIDSNINAGSGNDLISINVFSTSNTENSRNWFGTDISEAVGLEKSTIKTGSGDDKLVLVEISAYSFGS